MSIRFRGRFRELELHARRDPASRALPAATSDELARRRLEPILRDPLARHALHVLTDPGIASPHGGWSEDELLDAWSAALTSRSFRLLPVEALHRGGSYGGGPTRTSAGPSTQEAAPEQAPSSRFPRRSRERRPEEDQELPWVSFQLVDHDTEEPVSGVRMRVRKPDGTTETVTTDASGTVHLRGLAAGACEIEEILDDDALEVTDVA